ncbi:MAG TPA: hypothetical protein PKA00_02830 [Saprospiraceae bacterium]|nr:hypothetical protein [Saprospiraceae bacterium]HMQ81809.1 hypothetical protein [Saprospiraceae bacterium]
MAELLQKLNERGIQVLKQTEREYLLELDYVIEIEGNELFKLLQNGYVIAPFDDIDELCDFILMDKQLHEKG